MSAITPFSCPGLPRPKLHWISIVRDYPTLVGQSRTWAIFSFHDYKNLTRQYDLMFTYIKGVYQIYSLHKFGGKTPSKFCKGGVRNFRPVLPLSPLHMCARTYARMCAHVHMCARTYACIWTGANALVFLMGFAEHPSSPPLFGTDLRPCSSEIFQNLRSLATFASNWNLFQYSNIFLLETNMWKFTLAR